METFVAVADSGSLTAAAGRLKRPLTTVSRTIQQLEERLGAPLLVRTTRRLALTDVGRHYLESCRRVLADVAEAERTAAGEHGALGGRISVTATSVFGRMHVLPVVGEFLLLHPGVSARIMLLDRVVDFIEEGFDVAFRLGAPADSSLVAVKLGELRLVTCASPKYLQAHGVPKRPGDLKDHRLISIGTIGSDLWSYPGPKGRTKGADSDHLNINDALAAMDAAVMGLGVFRIFYYQVAELVRAGLLQTVLDDFEPPPLPLNLVRPESRMVPARVRAFIDFAVPALRQRIATLIPAGGSVG
jgi:DNA-binding transcriptional LysR family regulator